MSAPPPILRSEFPGGRHDGLPDDRWTRPSLQVNTGANDSYRTCIVRDAVRRCR